MVSRFLIVIILNALQRKLRAMDSTIILSHYGLRYTQNLLQQVSLTEFTPTKKDLYLLTLFDVKQRPRVNDALEQELIAEGFIHAREALSQEELQLRYDRNPLENVSRLVFEFTTVCNLKCHHCRCGDIPFVTDTNIERLKDAADLFRSMGVDYFEFVGGEVSKYGVGWLDLLSHIQSKSQATVALFTSGWWLEQKNFNAAGVQYRDDEEYLSTLKRHGLTHLVFSIDGPEDVHDRWRERPGLYRRILQSIKRVRAAGLQARVSMVFREDENTVRLPQVFTDFADEIYDFDTGTNGKVKMARLLQDPENTISNFIDIGNGAQLSQQSLTVRELTKSRLRCKAFYRPAPRLRIRANGELATCPLVNAGDGYGHLDQGPLVHLLNQLHESFVFKLHSEDKIRDYLPLVDRSIFGNAFDHICTLRSILTLIARTMNEQKVAMDDSVGIHRINLEVAKNTGHFRTIEC